MNLNILQLRLAPHPERAFAEYLIEGFVNGCDPNLHPGPQSSTECGNNLSACQDPEAVITLVHKEVRQGDVIGPFEQAPFQTFRVSPLTEIQQEETSYP